MAFEGVAEREGSALAGLLCTWRSFPCVSTNSVGNFANASVRSLGNFSFASARADLDSEVEEEERECSNCDETVRQYSEVRQERHTE